MDSVEIIQQLDKDDQDKILYFLDLLLKQAKYRKLKEEIEFRRKEIEGGEVVDHEALWNSLNV